MSEKLRAAVVGAAGIGKYHAQWYAVEGCEVVGFVGTSPESVAQTADALRSLLGFDVRGYTSLDEMLQRERPHCVSICTPPDRHAESTVSALLAGAHVLCEKPLLWNEARDPNSVLAEASQILRTAHQRGKVLAVNTQYAAVLEPFRKLHEDVVGPLGEVRSLLFEMESKGNRRGPNEYTAIWRELGPHALSLVLAVLPRGTIDCGTLEASMDRDHVNVRFRWVSEDAPPCDVTFLTSCIREGQPKRRFGLNGFEVDISAVREDGVYRTVLRRGDAEVKCDDLVRVSIRRFLAAVRGQAAPLADGSVGLRNLELQLQVLKAL